MTLKETCDIFIKWVQSCETQEQLDLLNEIGGSFVIERFATENRTDLLHQSSRVFHAIHEQSKLVTVTN